MRCLSQRNRGGITGHILRQYPLCRSCSICPLQCLNLFHKLLNQHTLRIRLQHRKEKQQGRGGGGVLPTFQVAICAAGNAKLLCHGFLRQRLLLPQGIQFLGEKLCEPVSYTHLDVYKRQAFLSPLRRLMQVPTYHDTAFPERPYRRNLQTRIGT